MKKQKIYISGKISGLDKEIAIANFAAAEASFNKEYTDVVNPINNGLKETRPWILHMIVDVFNMLRCSHVCFLSNYTDSRGAMIEYKIANLFGKQILYARLSYRKPQQLRRKKKETIRCPKCSKMCKAIVEWDEDFPFASYVHNCEHCGYIIMESEWNRIGD